MAALPLDRVHRGFWIDYTYGPVLGATITTTSARANIVIAVLSLLVSFTGANLWDLIAFTIYSLAISDRPRTALHHQKQILARNVASPGAYLLEVAKLGWAWRHHGVWSGLIIVAALALFCSAGFIVAGVFVSQVVQTSGLQVLVHSTSCGFVSWLNETTDLHRDYQQTVYKQAIRYAETCYNQSDPLPQCNLYAKSAIKVESATRTDCPFQGLCANVSALRFDTGLLDSNEIFGLNTRPGIRVQMQKVVSCAPLDLERFSNIRTMPLDYTISYEDRETLSGEMLLEWSVGQLKMEKRPFNSTFWQSSLESKYSKIYALTARAFYLSVNDTNEENWHNSTFTPIPELRRYDADVHVVGIQNNGVTFYAPNEDPLFSAHQKYYLMFDDNQNRTMYTGDKAATFLGCAEQMRFCFAQGSCTSLGGMNVAHHQAQLLAPTAEQSAIAKYLFLQTPTMYAVSTAPMLVTGNAASFQSKIPSNQWEIEFRAWFDYLLAMTQTAITHLAAGPGIARPDFDRLADPLVWADLCNSQRMGAPDGFSNINVFSLALIISVSGLIILVNLSLVPILKLLQRREIIHRPNIGSWIQDGLFQMMRRLYEGLEDAEWIHKDSDVPIIEVNPLLPALNVDVRPSGTRVEILKDDNDETGLELVHLAPIPTPAPAPAHRHASSTAEIPTPDQDQDTRQTFSSLSARRSSAP